MTAFLRPRPVEDPAVRLVVCHHAGGSSIAYYPITRGLPDGWDVLLVDLPGRGRRHRADAVTDMAALVEVVTGDVLPWTGPPVALFGHSLGALLAAEVGRTLQRMGTPPVWVGVSGRPGPSAPVPTDLRADVSDDQLMRALSATGGMPDRIDEVPGYREQFLRLVRRDLRAVDSYLPGPDRDPLVAPLTAFGGLDDDIAPPRAVAAWSRETTGAFRQRTYPGGHFYFLGPAFADLSAAVVHDVTAALDGVQLAGTATTGAEV